MLRGFRQRHPAIIRGTLLAFSFLLVHYLHDGVFFQRHRDLVPERGPARR